MKRAPNGEESAVTEHFFMQIGENMMSEHETQRIAASFPVHLVIHREVVGAFSRSRHQLLQDTLIGTVRLVLFDQHWLVGTVRSILCDILNLAATL